MAPGPLEFWDERQEIMTQQDPDNERSIPSKSINNVNTKLEVRGIFHIIRHLLLVQAVISILSFGWLDTPLTPTFVALHVGSFGSQIRDREGESEQEGRKGLIMSFNEIDTITTDKRSVVNGQT